ncbi:hypothetical protein KR018_004689 [Drosophila ironensis]|nr:hypothetical protein KR018_004689 [Drosophila ironensis]
MSSESAPKAGKAATSKYAASSTIVVHGADSRTLASAPAAAKKGTQKTGAGGRHRSRKSPHQTLQMSAADCEFEVEQEEEEQEQERKQEPKAKQVKFENQEEEEEESEETEAETETEALSRAEHIRKTIDQFVNAEEMQTLINTVAKERVRCNFLLATYQLPDMNFSLNTDLETLQFQFEERLKQRRSAPKSKGRRRSGPTRPTQ